MNYTDSMEVNLKYIDWSPKWEKDLISTLPQYKKELTNFVSDEEFGLRHSFEVFSKSNELAKKISNSYPGTNLNQKKIEELSLFHDIGKFFQEIHSLENVNIAESIFREFAAAKSYDQLYIEDICDSIVNSDFYNIRLDPQGRLPQAIEGDIVRAADKMQSNLVKKVDRYYDYGKQRGAILFNEDLSEHERETFSFDNFNGDQLNVILSILGLRPSDFSNRVLGEEYKNWVIPQRDKVVQRVLGLAMETGESNANIEKIKNIIIWYIKKFNPEIF